LIVVQEWWGLDAQTRSIADRFAAQGYLSFAPDLYHGEFATPGDAEKARILTQKYGLDAPADLETVFDELKLQPECTGRVGIVGFCFGGRMALTLGLTRPVEAVCTFYGGGIAGRSSPHEGFQAPAVLGLFGDRDVSIPLGTIEQFDILLDEIDVKHEVITYPDSGHAFFRDSDPDVYKPEAAADAWKRVTRFFEKHLG
jgi:carboxymethylenebutenolidase